MGRTNEVVRVFIDCPLLDKSVRSYEKQSKNDNKNGHLSERLITKDQEFRKEVKKQYMDQAKNINGGHAS